MTPGLTLHDRRPTARPLPTWLEPQALGSLASGGVGDPALAPQPSPQPDAAAAERNLPLSGAPPEGRRPNPAMAPLGSGGLVPGTRFATTAAPEQAPRRASAAAPQGPATSLGAQATTTGWLLLPGAGTTPTPRLWQWINAGQNSGLQNDRSTLVITHGWLGSGVTRAPADPSGFNPAFTALAQAAAAAGQQVLFLDWGQQAMDPSPSGLAPYNAAGRIQSVATWARDQLQTLAASGRRLSFAGHSLGSYLGAQTAVLLGSGPALRVQALDPAAAGFGGPYDLNSGNAIADPVPRFNTAAPGGSLAFVVADSNLTIGLAGDNGQAASAARSFVVSGFASGTSPSVAHGAIPALAADLTRYFPLDSELSDAILGSFRADQFSDSGGTSGTRRHEGVVRLRSNGGAVARIDGFSSSGLNQTVQFVDASDGATPSGSSSVRDGIVSLRSLQLSATASIEEVVLAGSAALTARGSSQAERLSGNQAGNQLSGEAGNDTLAGGLGNDTLSGGAGADSFRFDAALDGGGNVDRIVDFAALEGDQIVLENTGSSLFTALTTSGPLAAAAFIAANAFSNTSQRIRYESSSGNLFYDPDGSGGASSQLFAILSSDLALNNNQFLVT